MASFRCRFTGVIGSWKSVNGGMSFGSISGSGEVENRRKKISGLPWCDGRTVLISKSIWTVPWITKTSYEYHIGGNVYCTIAENDVCVDIKQYWKPGDQVVPTTKEICLRPSEYVRLEELLPEIGNALPELDGVVPCLLQSDQMNPLGALQCSECNPNDFYNWWL